MVTPIESAPAKLALRSSKSAPRAELTGLLPPPPSSSFYTMSNYDKVVKLACKPKPAPPKSKVREVPCTLGAAIHRRTVSRHNCRCYLVGGRLRGRCVQGSSTSPERAQRCCTFPEFLTGEKRRSRCRCTGGIQGLDRPAYDDAQWFTGQRLIVPLLNRGSSTSQRVRKPCRWYVVRLVSAPTS